jgi:hypothetical protein
MSRRRGLPSPTAATPLTQVLDALTDPGNPGNSDPAGTSGVSGALGVPVNENASGTNGSRDTAGTPGNPDTSETRGASRKPRPAAREHVKLRRDLAAEMSAGEMRRGKAGAQEDPPQRGVGGTFRTGGRLR